MQATAGDRRAGRPRVRGQPDLPRLVPDAAGLGRREALELPVRAVVADRDARSRPAAADRLGEPADARVRVGRKLQFDRARPVAARPGDDHGLADVGVVGIGARQRARTRARAGRRLDDRRAARHGIGRQLQANRPAEVRPGGGAGRRCHRTRREHGRRTSHGSRCHRYRMLSEAHRDIKAGSGRTFAAFWERTAGLHRQFTGRSFAGGAEGRPDQARKLSSRPALAPVWRPRS